MSRAEQILTELNMQDAESIDLLRIAQHLKVKIKERRLTGCEAMIAGFGDRAIVSVNSDSPTARKRFSIAHELGHWIFDKGEAKFCKKEDYTHWRIGNREYRANEFAANLLLPRSMLSGLSEFKVLTFSEVDDAARVFVTSRMATAIRLVQISKYPCLIAYYEVGARKWFHANRHVPPEFFPHTLLRNGSIAKEIQLRGKTAEASKEVDADSWFDKGDPEKYTVWESSIASPNGVLTLISWHIEDHIVDFYNDEDEE